MTVDGAGYAATLRAAARRGDRSATLELQRKGWALPKAMPTRFGVECEFFGMGQDTAVDVLNMAGIEARNDGYHHQRRDYWRVTEDSSVNAEGCEMVTPVLTHTRDLPVVKQAVRRIMLAGALIDSSCGIHVHHGLPQAGSLRRTKVVAEAVAHYAAWQPIINKLIVPSRLERDNYGRAMSGPGRWYQNIRSNASQLARWADWQDRYEAVNLNAISAHGTLEFRQHHASLDGEEIADWVSFTQLFMNIGQRHTWTDVFDTFGSAESATVREMADYMGADDSLATRLADKARRIRTGYDVPEYVDHDGEPDNADEHWGCGCEYDQRPNDDDEDY